MTKILLIDDHQVILESLKLLFRSIKDVEVVGTLNDSRMVMKFLENESSIDLLVTDLHMPYLSGIDLTLLIRNTYPNIKILLLTMAEDAIHIREALKAGVHGYILKKSGREELEKAIERIMNGKRYYSEEVVDELAANPDEDYNNSRPETIERLTPREIDVLKLIAQEKSTNEIAEILFVSVPTIETHRGNLMKKLNVKSAIGMVKFAIKHGLVE